MFNRPNPTPVEAAPKAFGAATLRQSQAARLPLQRARFGCCRAFTLAELLVSVAVLVLIVLLATQLLHSAATITILAHKQMDADSQARELLDRVALDFAQMVKRSDVDYYLKSSATAPLRRVVQPGNDQIAFYGTVPGYHHTGASTTRNSPVSLVSYRVNSQNMLERMGKGLVWNAVSGTDNAVLFLPIPLASPLPSPLPSPMPNPFPTPAWPGAAIGVTDWTDSEVIGPQVFRFEYYYLLIGGILSDVPWSSPAHNAVNGMQDVAAIVVDIAVIDPKSKALVTNCQLAQLNGAPAANCQPQQLLVDYAPGMLPGQLLTQWRAAVDTNTIGLAKPAISGIRLYERYFCLSPPVVQSP
jgi:type II secretory pathway component PulJ